MSDFSAFANRTIKVTYDGETRRGHLAITPGASPAEAFSAIEAAVGTLFEISPLPMVGYRITYPDEDGDFCTLTQHTVNDFALLAPEGIVRLTLTSASTSGKAGSIEVPLRPGGSSGPMEADAAATGADQSGATSSQEDAALRAKLQDLVLKIPKGMRLFLFSMIQGMDPNALHSLLGHALAHVEHSAEQNHESQEASKVLNTLRGMEASAVHALALEVLKSEVDSDMRSGTEDANPLEAMLGTLFGGKGCGKGGYPGGPAAPNPMDFLGPLLAGKGCGKGGGMAEAQMPNPMASFVAGLGEGTGCPQGAANHGQPPNPMETLFGLLGAGKGSGKGFGTETTGSVPPPTPSAASQCDAVSSNGDADRAAFEESVNDLLSMGLITDRQMARELLTQHGDISSVVDLLADGEL